MAQKAQPSEATLYLYPKCKDSLITAILERMFGGAFPRLGRRLSTQSPGTEAVLRFTDEAIRAYEGMLRFLRWRSSSWRLRFGAGFFGSGEAVPEGIHGGAGVRSFRTVSMQGRPWR